MSLTAGSADALLERLQAAGATVLGSKPASVSFPAHAAAAVLTMLKQAGMSLSALSHTRALAHHGGEVQMRLLTQATAADASVAVAHVSLARASDRQAVPLGSGRRLPVPLSGGSVHDEHELVTVLAVGYLDRQPFAVRLHPLTPHEQTLAVLLLDATHVDPVTPLRDGIAYALTLAATPELIAAARLLSV